MLNRVRRCNNRPRDSTREFMSANVYSERLKKNMITADSFHSINVVLILKYFINYRNKR